jgi:ERCC4-type nuclease
LILLEDSRQQEGKHKNIHLYCKRHGIEIVRKCLKVGDYMLSEDGENPCGDVIVDTKQDLMELCKDVMSNDHRRFRRQCEKAQEMGLKLIILVEEAVPYGRVDM